MAAKLTHDIVLKVGQYTDRQGNTKAKSKNIGSLWTKDDGSMFLSLDSTIIAMNVQHVANREGADKIMVSVFPVREDRNTGGGNAAPAARQAPAAQPPAPSADFPADDDIPF